MLKIAVLMLAMFAVAMADEKSIYDGKWNHINTHEIIDNPRLWKKTKECLLADDEPSGCPAEVKDLKRVLPEALRTTCEKCTPDHVEKIKDTLSYFCKQHQEEGDAILHKYDATGEYRPVFEAKFGKIDDCK